MKLSEINKNVLVIVSSILTDTVNYLRDTTEITKAASGRTTQVALGKRAAVLEKLVLEARAGKDRELTKVEEEVVKDVYTYYKDSYCNIVTGLALDEGEEMAVLPAWELPKGDESTRVLHLALLHAIASATKRQDDIKAYLNYANGTVAKLGGYLDGYVYDVLEKFHEFNLNAMDAYVTKEFGELTGAHTLKELGKAIENLVKRVNEKETTPSISELTLSPDDFDRIGAAVDAMYGTNRVVVRKSARDDVPSDRPVPHYTRVNSTRKANVVLVLKAGKIDGVSFTGF